MPLSSVITATIMLLAILPVRGLDTGHDESPASISPRWFLLQELTRPPGLFVWETLMELERCDAERLRDLAREVRQAQFHGIPLMAAPLVTEAAAERDLAGAVTDILADMQKVNSTATPRAKIESDAVLLACRMAGRDWKKLLELLQKVKPDPAFWLPLAADIELAPEKLPAFLTAASVGMNERRLPDIAGRVLWTTVKQHGTAATAKQLKAIKNRPVRQVAEVVLRELKKAPPLPDSPIPDKSPPLKSVELRRLLALDTSPGEPRRIPFALLRAVRRFSPAEALSLAEELPRDPAPPGHWLAWMLFMRAAEGDPVAATTVAVETGGQLIRAGQATASLYALRQELDADTALREVRDITSPDAQRQAMGGILTGRTAQEFILKEHGNPLLALATQTKLPAAYWRAGLCRAATSGGGIAALQQAEHLPWEPPIGRAMLQEDIIKAWALTDLPSLQTWAAKLTNPDEISPVTAALVFLKPLLAQEPQ